MKATFIARVTVGALAVSFLGLLPVAAQIRSDWSEPVNLTALNSSAADA